MKSIHECDQNEKMLRALLVIDGMSLTMTEYEQSPNSKESPTHLEHFISAVYCISHAAHGTCGDGKGHGKWLDQIEENAKFLKKMNVFDLEKVLKEIEEGKRPRDRRCKKCDGQGWVYLGEGRKQEDQYTCLDCCGTGISPNKGLLHAIEESQDES